jgi:hypothetical protein
MVRKSTAEVIIDTYRTASGEPDVSVTPDSDDGRTVLNILNQFVDAYYNAVDQYGQNVIWQRNVEPFYIVGTSNGTDTTYEVDWQEVQVVQDGYYTGVYVGPDRRRYDLVPYFELYDSRHSSTDLCSITNQGLEFRTAPVPGDITIAALVRGKYLTGNETDVSAVTGVTSVHWLTLAAAAEFSRNDFVRANQYPNLLARANEAFTHMYNQNEARTQAVQYNAERTRQFFSWEASQWA